MEVFTEHKRFWDESLVRGARNAVDSLSRDWVKTIGSYAAFLFITASALWGRDKRDNARSSPSRKLWSLNGENGGV